MILVSISVN